MALTVACVERACRKVAALRHALSNRQMSKNFIAKTIYYNLDGGMKSVLVFVGTRPEAIKMAPVIIALERFSSVLRTRVCATGQHRELLADALADFDVKPDIELGVMTEGQTLSGLSSRLFSEIDQVLIKEIPDAVLVQGDTTTVMIAALAAFYRSIPAGHVEAGLRSHKLHEPFPEEINRRVASLATRWHFAPTALSRANLMAEGIDAANVFVTGNPVIDALYMTADKEFGAAIPMSPFLNSLLMQADRRRVLITAHRRENFGQPFLQICEAIRILANRHSDVDFIYPVHPNPNIIKVAQSELSGISNIHLIEPLSYRPFVKLLKSVTLVISDSGGLQEEGPAFGKPVLVMRDVTERPEGVEAGVNILVGTDPDIITSTASRLLTDADAYSSIAVRKNPFGDGAAGQKIANIMASALTGVV